MLINKKNGENKKFSSRNFYKQYEPWFYLTPALIWFLCFAIFPLIYTINTSVRDFSDAERPLVGFKHYSEIFTSEVFFSSVFTTTKFVIGTVVLSFIFGFSLAILLAKENLWFKAFFRSILILPYVVSDVVIGINARLMLHPVLGVINYITGSGQTDWLGSPDTALYSLILVTTWQLTPFFTIILLAGLLSLPKEQFEAAKIEGANPWQIFTNITLPLMRPVCQVVLLMGFIDIVKVFAIIYLTTYGGPGKLTYVVGLYVYHTAFRFYRFDLAAAMAVILIIIISILAFILMRALAEKERTAN